ncbi:aspartyl/asparaginyl beta-hydroxylase domain-containing protein [Spirulina sp. 06S082]|uniref:aspartyl/asparaginyl beta-hydroxylase domain-containing protein n=1 Tax=Spirulina sp. 06S082 TaxID=3110248 RepID=UPI002B2001EB|nr:aspartyl/asparaginyl beta-hydroxylase domain-containing protein [Spirulina sp. 06S082]MEA5471092.1 aspartyl/asparaginyl beta-hydroxylase domain-containing protein [Spirulina sp. 06S082]
MNWIQKFLAKLNRQHHQFVVKHGETMLRAIEAHIAKQSLIEDAAFFECDRFPWIPQIEVNWQIIRQEVDDLLKVVNFLPNFQDISADQYDITSDDLWKTYFLYGYGFKAEKNCRRCPQTTRLIEQIPGMKTAFFSILLPHKQIPEHRGPYKGVLRYHLGLKIPQSSHACGLRVGGKTRYWQEGKSLIFDDTRPHEAWNLTDEIRVVLFVDVVRPLRFPFSCLNRMMIQAIAWSPYVQGSKREAIQWENRLEQMSLLAAENCDR